jgi:uncharacterized protein
MTRLLLLIAIGVIVFLLLRRWLARNAGPAQPPAYMPMVSCMSCGLHLPRDSAIERNGRYYCCREHADQSPR